MPLSLETFRRSVSFSVRRKLRAVQDLAMARRFTRRRIAAPLPHLVKEHRLPIFRNYPGVDRGLFENKRHNLQLAAEQLDGVLLEPGKVFSLWRWVGPPTGRRGFREGLVLDKGRPSRGVGGGLCQMANGLFWLALHSELKVTERHHHSLDLFPDDHRQVPFGTGASIVYNFKDLRILNPGTRRYQWKVQVEPEFLVVQLRSDSAPSHRYEIREADHQFMPKPEGLFRQNSILREKRDGTGNVLSVETLFQNFAKCQYTLQEAL